MRLVDEPATQGQEFLLASAPGNVAVGEDIRNLTRAEAERLRPPQNDSWLLDSRVLARFAFDEDDTTLGVYVTEDPAEVLGACQARDVAWHHAVRTEEFAKRVCLTRVPPQKRFKPIARAPGPDHNPDHGGPQP